MAEATFYLFIDRYSLTRSINQFINYPIDHCPRFCVTVFRLANHGFVYPSPLQAGGPVPAGGVGPAHQPDRQRLPASHHPLPL